MSLVDISQPLPQPLISEGAEVAVGAPLRLENRMIIEIWGVL